MAILFKNLRRIPRCSVKGGEPLILKGEVLRKTLRETWHKLGAGEPTARDLEYISDKNTGIICLCCCRGYIVADEGPTALSTVVENWCYDNE